MTPRGAAVAAVIVLSIARSVGVAQEPARSPASLQELRAAIREFRNAGGQPPGSPFELSGYSFDWELTTGGDFTVAVISRNLQGQIAVYSSDGLLAASLDTGEIQSVQLCDLDNDGIAEIITDEVTERGTGLLTRKFAVYQVSGASVKKLWDGVSYGHLYHAKGQESPHFSSSSGYLRCDPSGGDRPRPRLLYVHETDDGHGAAKRNNVTLELEGGRIVERTNSAKRIEPQKRRK